MTRPDSIACLQDQVHRAKCQILHTVSRYFAITVTQVSGSSVSVPVELFSFSESIHSHIKGPSLRDDGFDDYLCSFPMRWTLDCAASQCIEVKTHISMDNVLPLSDVSSDETCLLRQQQTPCRQQAAETTVERLVTLAIIASMSSSVMVPPPPLNTISAPYRTMDSRSSLLTLALLSDKRPCWMIMASNFNFFRAFSITCVDSPQSCHHHSHATTTVV